MRGVNIGGSVCAIVTFRRSNIPFKEFEPGSDTWDKNNNLCRAELEVVHGKATEDSSSPSSKRIKI